MRVTIKEYFFDNDEEAPFDGILLFDGDFAQISFDVENVPYTYQGERVRGEQWLLKCASNGGTATLNKSVLNETGYEGTLIFQHLSNPRYQSMWEIEPADSKNLIP